jgi:hypothetical protein
VTVTGTVVPLKAWLAGPSVLMISSSSSGSAWSAAPYLEAQGGSVVEETFVYEVAEGFAPGATYDVTLYSFLSGWYGLSVEVTLVY